MCPDRSRGKYRKRFLHKSIGNSNFAENIPSPVATLAIDLIPASQHLTGLSDHSLAQHRQPFKQFIEKMMHMTFYWGKKVTLLFDSWNTDTWSSYLLTLLAVFLFSAFYQYMEDRRLRFKLISCVPQPRVAPLTAALLQPSSRVRNSARFACSVLFGLNSALGYLLMLALMSFNGGVFVAIVVGLAVGYFLFRSGKEDVLVVENGCACA